jgi:hypothetical protein
MFSLSEAKCLGALAVICSGFNGRPSNVWRSGRLIPQRERL